MYADYDFYTNQYGGTDIPAEKWPRLADRADAHMDALTFGRLKRGWPTTDAVRMACCAMAELLNGQRTGGALEAAAGVKSEATDGYSVSYGTYAETQSAAQAMLTEAAGVYLPPSDPLRYAGLYCRRGCGC